MATFDVPLPEITVEEFSRAWNRFELVSTAKGWDADKQAAILPTLLRGKLVDHYVDLDVATKVDLQQQKTALMGKTGLAQDPLTAGKSFIARCQRSGEKVADFASDLKKLFKQAYPEELLTSGILLQHFVTGLMPRISQQILLKGKPTKFEEAVMSAEGLEYALNFKHKSPDPTTQTDEINAVGKPHCSEDPKLITQVQQALDQMTERLESLETRLQLDCDGSSYKSPRNFRCRGPSNGTRGKSKLNQECRSCWECGELGHLQRNCPHLNYHGPARTVPGWPRS